MKPILGILSVWQGEADTRQPFGEQTPLFEAIQRAASEFGIHAYVFPPQDLTNERGTVYSYIYRDGNWNEGESLFPHVVYDRLPNRELERNALASGFRQMLLQRTGGRVFNRAGFFSKWGIHSHLKNVLPKHLLLPATERMDAPERAMQRITDWHELWIKPDAGSLGRGVYRVQKEPLGYTLESSDHGSTEQLEAADLLAFFRTLCGNEPCILQQGIQRAEYHHRPFDIRVFLQKNQRGEFVISKSFARLASAGQIVSNLHAGGDGLPLKALLTLAERKTLRNLALVCAKRLDAVLPGPTGELGLDLAMDTYRRFWLIEANSKPFLKMDQSDPRTRIIARRIVTYALHLSRSSPARKRSTPRSGPKLFRHVSKGH